MSISLTKRNFLYQITLLTLIAGWVGAGILHYLLPGHYFGGYPFIPVYFFLFGLLKYLCLMLAVSMPRKRCCCFTWR